jgi:hypothetical protein
MVGIFYFQNYFTIGNDGGLGPRLMDHWRRWSTVDYGRGRLKASLVLSLAAAPVLGGSSAMEQWRESAWGVRFGPHRGTGDGVATGRRRWWHSVWAVLGYGKKRKRAGGGAVEDGGAIPLLQGPRGAVVKAEEWPVLMHMKWLPLN